MAGKTFSEGVRELKEIVGTGTLKGRISVNQIYSHYQDGTTATDVPGHGPHGKPSIAFDHPRGGEAGFLSNQMVQRRYEVMAKWADNLLRGRVIPETIAIMQSIRDQVYLRAPREYDILRNSTSLRLQQRGEVLMDAPAMMPRLSQAELNAIRSLGNPDKPMRTLVRRYR